MKHVDLSIFVFLLCPLHSLVLAVYEKEICDCCNQERLSSCFSLE
ncbi:hypothetical protein Nmel_013710, partial [Mimus melanotis]